VGAAVNKSIQAALVFFLSDICYCPTHPWNHNKEKDTQLDQCLNSWKIIGFIGTVLASMVYTLDGVLWGRDKLQKTRSGEHYGELSAGE